MVLGMVGLCFLEGANLMKSEVLCPMMQTFLRTILRVPSRVPQPVHFKLAPSILIVPCFLPCPGSVNIDFVQ
jgi:hypothetical protein